MVIGISWKMFQGYGNAIRWRRCRVPPVGKCLKLSRRSSRKGLELVSVPED